MNKRSGRTRLLFFSFFSVIIFFGGLELLLRVTQFYFQPVQYDGWITGMLKKNRYLSDPILLFKINPKSDWDTINSQGFRDTREYERHKKEGIFRIICLGNSTVFGAGSQLKDSYPKILEAMLNKGKNSNFEVLNFGIPGYTSFQGLKLLQAYAIAYSPNIVIINFVWNDLWERNAGVKEDKYQRPLCPFIAGTLNILERFISFQLLEKSIYIVRTAFGNSSKAKTQWHTRVSLADYSENYRKMILLLKEKRIGCLIVISPADVRRNYMPRYKAYITALRKIAEEYNTSIIEPDGLFITRPDDCFLEDGFHLTAIGNTLIAKAIFSTMEKTLIVK